MLTKSNILLRRLALRVLRARTPIRSALGLHEKPPVHEDHEDYIHHQLLWSRIRLTLQEPFAEFWGTAIMAFFRNSSVVQVLLSAGNTPNLS